jgi:hypothetical protein
MPLIAIEMCDYLPPLARVRRVELQRHETSSRHVQPVHIDDVIGTVALPTIDPETAQREIDPVQFVELKL